eukprot:GILK01002607.1.p1 GENE.GILK01002607.1~~GILK01002607.1.p1  ORF type:complete len:105 (+),score=4.61 GILK01002607.1:46-315(+)
MSASMPPPSHQEAAGSTGPRIKSDPFKDSIDPFKDRITRKTTWSNAKVNGLGIGLGLFAFAIFCYSVRGYRGDHYRYIDKSRDIGSKPQ